MFRVSVTAVMYVGVLFFVSVFVGVAVCMCVDVLLCCFVFAGFVCVRLCCVLPFLCLMVY